MKLKFERLLNYDIISEIENTYNFVLLQFYENTTTIPHVRVKIDIFPKTSEWHYD